MQSRLVSKEETETKKETRNTKQKQKQKQETIMPRVRARDTITTKKDVYSAAGEQAPQTSQLKAWTLYHGKGKRTMIPITEQERKQVIADVKAGKREPLQAFKIAGEPAKSVDEIRKAKAEATARQLPCVRDTLNVIAVSLSMLVSDMTEEKTLPTETALNTISSLSTLASMAANMLNGLI